MRQSSLILCNNIKWKLYYAPKICVERILFRL